MQQKPFPVASDSLLTAISAYLQVDGQELAAKILRSSFAELVQTEYDNWNGGTYYYCLHIHVSAENFASLNSEDKQTLENTICGKLSDFGKPYPNQRINTVLITPTLTASISHSQSYKPQNHEIPSAILKFIALAEQRDPGSMVEATAIAQELETHVTQG